MSDPPHLSAADRFRAAALARNPTDAAREFADDIAMFNPMSAEPLIGRAAVAAALGRLDAAFDTFEHVQVLVDRDPPSDGVAETQAIVFRAEIGEHTIEGIDLLDVNEDDQIVRFTVLARPLSALQALGHALMAQGRP